MARFKRGDAVRMRSDTRDSYCGVVTRSARDGSWVDVLWMQSTERGDSTWTKRQPDSRRLCSATPAQRSLAAIFFALNELVADGLVEVATPESSR